MKTIHYRRWEPVQSPVKIEFRQDVIQALHSRRDEARGYLYGSREGDLVRVVAAGTETSDKLETLGIYATRIRGEVFLTDADLEHAERIQSGIALVLAGRRAGFFTREANGSIQAVRSYEEFSIVPAAPAMPRPKRHPWLPPVNVWKWTALAAGTLALPLMGMSFLQERMTMPTLSLSLREANGQLVLEWDRSAAANGAHLEISEGEIRSVITLASDSTSATYLPKTRNVEFELKAGGRSGRAQWKAPKYSHQP
jgi:hypothetical protein